MKSLVLALTLVALGGCESTKELCAEHPVACPVLIGLVGTALLMCVGPNHGHSQGKTQPQPEIPTPSVHCSNPESCR